MFAIIWKMIKNIIQMNNFGWYINLYYKFREYPITELNSMYKTNELKSIYNGMLKKLFTLFQLDNRRDGEIQGIISKNNFDHMLNKRAEGSLQQQEIIGSSRAMISKLLGDAVADSKQPLSRQSLSSQAQIGNRSSEVSDTYSRWLMPCDPSEKNMDVFYELMIKMIRISLRRLTIQTFAIDKYGKTISKDAMREINKNTTQYEDLHIKISGEESTTNSEQNQQIIEVTDFPNSIEELKFQFLKYCISCKVYNNPTSADESSDSAISNLSSKRQNSESKYQSQADSKSQELPTEKLLKPIPKISNNQIQELIMKVSQSQTSIFNKIIDKYLNEIKKQGNNHVQIIGIKNITQTLFEMASGQNIFQTTNSIQINNNRYRKDIFDETGEYDKKSNALSNSNILLATWFDLILFKQNPSTLFGIIQELVFLQQKYGYLDSVGVTTPNLTLPQNRKFYYKVVSYLHLLILNSTKNIFIQSLCKINYLLIILDDVIGTKAEPNKIFHQIQKKKYQQKQINCEKKVYQNIQFTYDTKAGKYLWKEEAMSQLLNKWKLIANVITEVCVKNGKAFFASMFQKCTILLDRQLNLQVELIELLMGIAENISIQKEIKKSDKEKCEHTKKLINLIVKEIIGFTSLQDRESQELDGDDKFLKINHFINSKSNDKHKQSSFANRQNCAEELSKWSEIINENIYLYSQYRDNLKSIIRLFRNNNLYVALWFIRFHSETKTLMRKVQKSKVEKIFKKFNAQTPVLWQSMSSDKEQKNIKSRFKRSQRGKFRNRISSIKSENNLTIIEKKAIVLNYILKAELELYSHYMLVNYLNDQKNISELFEKESGITNDINSKPLLFNHQIIKNILLFNFEEQNDKVTGLQDVKTLICRRSQKHYSSNLINVPKSTQTIQNNVRTMKNIDKSEHGVEVQIQDLRYAIDQFQRPMNIQLNLKEGWKQKFDEHSIDYLGQLYDYIRYLNEVNYLHEFYSWTQSTFGKKELNCEKKQKLTLLNGREYKQDLDEIDSYFNELKTNELYKAEIVLMKGETNKILFVEQISQMIKRIKLHNKELYMINESIIEGEHYYKLIGNNLLGRDKFDKFKSFLEESISFYKQNKRETIRVKIFQKIRESLQFEHSFIHKESKFTQSNFSDMHNKQTIRLIKESSQGHSKFGKKSTINNPFISHFEFTPQYYKIKSKIFRINCLIGSFYIDNIIYKNIKNNRVLSKQRRSRLVIIGDKFYNLIEEFQLIDRGQQAYNQLMISEHILVRVKNIYEKKVLLLLMTLMNLNYYAGENIKRYTAEGRNSAKREFTNIPEEDIMNFSTILKKYSEILKNFIYCKIRENIKRMEQRQKFEKSNLENERKQNKEFNICNFLQQIMELSSKQQNFGQQALLVQFQNVIQNQSNLKFRLEFKKQFQSLSESLNIYSQQEQKVDYLRKKLSYLLMREMYFTLNYDNDFLTEKSINSKRNYRIYEERILKFYEEIITLDYQEYIEKKEQEIKKRSIHLKNYQFKYQQQPSVSTLQKNVNQLVCCLFNQLLIMYTTTVEYKMFTRKHTSNHLRNFKHQHLFQQYCSSEFEKKQNSIQQKASQRSIKHQKRVQKGSMASRFASVFMKTQTEDSPFPQDPQRVQSRNDIIQDTQNTCNILVYTPQKFNLSKSIKVYLRILTDFKYVMTISSEQKRLNSCLSFKQEPITQMELEIIKNNERSLITMLKSQYLQRIHEAKCNFIRKNLISNIERLYINLDVRHKVFQSFKDRILNYEMQKAKIYHQYMDYIRGLKLDVYSNMAGQQPQPYIKIVHAVKIYRLNVKKLELEKRVNQQFQKNLQKWNEGIQKNLRNYDEWLLQQEDSWKMLQENYENQKKDLFDIYHVVTKEIVRQKKVTEQKKFSYNKTLYEKQLIIKRQPLLKGVHKGQQAKLNDYLVKRSANTKKQSPFIKKNKLHVNFNSDSRIQQKGNANTQYTRPDTRHEKITVHSKSQSGLRGLSIKYNVSEMFNDPKKNSQLINQNNDANFGTKTLSTSVYLKKGNQRYLSAQKYRPSNLAI